MPREPGEQPKDDSTPEQKQEQQRWEDNQSREAERSNDKYWGPNGPN